jgi:hypothetical protein
MKAAWQAWGKSVRNLSDNHRPWVWRMSVVVGAGLLSIASAALAQSAVPVAPPPLDRAGVARPAPIDPERLALARELFAQMHMDKMLAGVLANMSRSVPNALGTSASGVKVQQMRASFGAGMAAVAPQMVDALVEIYARTLTAQELRDAIAFDKTASGQAMLTKLPMAMSQFQPFMLTLMPKIWRAAEKDYCGHLACTEADHALFQRLQARYGQAAATPSP